MKLIIEAVGLTLTPSLKIEIEEKLGNIEKFFRDTEAMELRVEISRPSTHHKKGDVYYAEANLKIPGGLLRATATNEDMYLAIDGARHILERQITQHKDKQITRDRRNRAEE